MNNKNTILQIPIMTSTAIAALLGAIVKTLELDFQIMEIINLCIAPLSIIFSYAIEWLTAKFSSFSIVEIKSLSKLNARQKIIRKELKRKDISEEMQEKLHQHLDVITLEKCQIGRKDTIVDEIDT